ncbi:MAG: hypothetical protein LBK42_03820 [Propionibacteriaceae bacterium]|nr:hypothetical protein [Propionibacteriaceae bacterium]
MSDETFGPQGRPARLAGHEDGALMPPPLPAVDLTDPAAPSPAAPVVEAVVSTVAEGQGPTPWSPTAPGPDTPGAEAVVPPAGTAPSSPPWEPVAPPPEAAALDSAAPAPDLAGGADGATAPGVLRLSWNTSLTPPAGTASQSWLAETGPGGAPRHDAAAPVIVRPATETDPAVGPPLAPPIRPDGATVPPLSPPATATLTTAPSAGLGAQPDEAAPAADDLVPPPGPKFRFAAPAAPAVPALGHSAIPTAARVGDDAGTTAPATPPPTWPTIPPSTGPAIPPPTSPTTTPSARPAISPLTVPSSGTTAAGTTSTTPPPDGAATPPPTSPSAGTTPPSTGPTSLPSAPRTSATTPPPTSPAAKTTAPATPPEGAVIAGPTGSASAGTTGPAAPTGPAAARAARAAALGEVPPTPDVVTAPRLHQLPSTYQPLPSLSLLLLRLVVIGLMAIRIWHDTKPLSATVAMWENTILPLGYARPVAYGQIVVEAAIAILLLFGLGTRLAGVLTTILSVAWLGLILWGYSSPFDAAGAGVVLVGEYQLLLAAVGLVLFGLGGGGWLTLDSFFHRARVEHKNAKVS